MPDPTRAKLFLSVELLLMPSLMQAQCVIYKLSMGGEHLDQT